MISAGRASSGRDLCRGKADWSACRDPWRTVPAVLTEGFRCQRCRSHPRRQGV